MPDTTGNDDHCVASVWSPLRKHGQAKAPLCVTLVNGKSYLVAEGIFPRVGDDSRSLTLRPIDDNLFLQGIYRERLESAEASADRVRQIQQSIIDKWARMAKEGVLYSSSERQGDNAALVEAEEQFRLVLVSVYEVEDRLRH